MSLTAPRLVDAPPQLVLQTDLPRADLADTIGDALSRLTAHALARDLGCGPTFVRRPADGPTVTVGVCVKRTEADPDDGCTPGELPAGKLAFGIWTGDFASLEAGHAALAAWATAQGHTPAGAPWEVPITGPRDVERARDARTQLYLPLK